MFLFLLSILRRKLKMKKNLFILMAVLVLAASFCPLAALLHQQQLKPPRQNP
jgi:uncharacterized lipoprotein YajG